jgi:hypothetical protein
MIEIQVIGRLDEGGPHGYEWSERYPALVQDRVRGELGIAVDVKMVDDDESPGEILIDAWHGSPVAAAGNETPRLDRQVIDAICRESWREDWIEQETMNDATVAGLLRMADESA